MNGHGNSHGSQLLLHKVGPSTYVHGALQPETHFALAGVKRDAITGD